MLGTQRWVPWYYYNPAVGALVAQTLAWCTQVHHFSLTSKVLPIIIPELPQVGWLGSTGNKQGAGGLVGFCGLASCGFSLFSFSYKQTEASFINSHFMGGLSEVHNHVSVVHNHRLIAAAVLHIEPTNLNCF